MSKTGKSKYELKDVPMTDWAEAVLWRDDTPDGQYSVSLPDPIDGIRSSRDVLALAKKLTQWGNRMKKAGQ